MLELSGKCAFVTGAASGIGAAIATSLGSRGARLVLADINQDAVELFAEDLRDQGHEVLAVPLDVSSSADWTRARDTALSRYGRVDVLCNNAGVGPARKPLTELTDADFDLAYGVNVKGVLNGVQTFVPLMRADGRPGHIVNTASVVAHFAQAGIGDYVASKFAVLGLSETLRIELLDTRVGISILCPGLVHTNLHQNSQALRHKCEDTSNKEPSLINLYMS